MPAKRRKAAASSSAPPTPASDSSLSDATPPTDVEDVEAEPAVTGGDEEAYDDAAPAKEEKAPAANAQGSQLEKLHYLLQQSSIYSKIIAEKMGRERQSRAAAEDKAEKRAAPKAAAAPTSRKTRRGGADTVADEAKPEASTSQPAADATDAKPKAASGSRRKAATAPKTEAIADVMDEADLAAASKSGIDPLPDDEVDQIGQPKLVTGAELRDYQLEGISWLDQLYRNGLNGILADEMGLGKTLQTIAFLAHLHEQEVFGPYLIVAPLSTIANWVMEFERFTPDLPVVLYHGSPAERAEIRRTRLTYPTKADKAPRAPAMRRGGSKASKASSKAASRAASRDGTPAPVEVHKTFKTFPIVVTSYELVMNDRAELSRFLWQYIVVDESHRLKNANCKLLHELRRYPSANRLLLTGTPLHNNLQELWALLNFILPDIFDNLESFQSWFDIDVESQNDVFSDEQQQSILSNLHAILKPFLLRRMKADVESALPPKKEYLLQAPLTAQQKELYDAVVNRQLRSYLVDQKTRGVGGSAGTSIASSPAPSDVDASMTDAGSAASTPARKRRKVNGKGKNYADVSDEQFFDAWDANESDPPEDEDEAAAISAGRAHQLRQAERSVNNMKLQNIVMQLRKVCNHPWLFDWPRDPDTGLEVINDDLVNASGKMLLLNRLLDELFARGHKVLLFSQFTSQLDIIQDWATEHKGWAVCRIDGTTKQDDRRQQIKAFNTETGPEAPNMFLLSTRSGGVGISLTAADTVIFMDSDWNPQMDLQAQDRAHRIGQTKPVLIFRLVAGNTIEQHILKRAGQKRKLEQLVLGAGKFSGADVSEFVGKKRKRTLGMTAIAEALLADRSEEITLASKDDQLLSDEQLETLLDRSDEAMGRGVGWTQAATSAGSAAKGKGKKRASPAKAVKSGFEVYETQADPDQDEDFLSKIMANGGDE